MGWLGGGPVTIEGKLAEREQANKNGGLVGNRVWKLLTPRLFCKRPRGFQYPWPVLFTPLGLFVFALQSHGILQRSCKPYTT